jgi:hypothetical protein
MRTGRGACAPPPLDHEACAPVGAEAPTRSSRPRRPKPSCQIVLNSVTGSVAGPCPPCQLRRIAPSSSAPSPCVLLPRLNLDVLRRCFNPATFARHQASTMPLPVSIATKTFARLPFREHRLNQKAAGRFRQRRRLRVVIPTITISRPASGNHVLLPGSTCGFVHDLPCRLLRTNSTYRNRLRSASRTSEARSSPITREVEQSHFCLSTGVSPFIPVLSRTLRLEKQDLKSTTTKHHISIMLPLQIQFGRSVYVQTQICFRRFGLVDGASLATFPPRSVSLRV